MSKLEKLETSYDVGRKILRDLRQLRVFTVILAVLLLGGGTWGYIDLSKKGKDARTAQQALCVFRADLQNRVDQSEAYLKDHPEGFPGISAATIRQGIQNQKATVKSLTNLRCENVRIGS